MMNFHPKQALKYRFDYRINLLDEEEDKDQIRKHNQAI